MTKYKDIHGFQIEVRSDNPSNPANGQVWYNTTTSKLRGNAKTTVGAFSTGGNMNQGRSDLCSFGTQTSALVAGGGSWTETTDMNEVKNQGTGAGTVTSGLAFGGAQATAPTAKTETWNGTAWTEVGDMNTARAHMTGFGISSGSALGCMEGNSVNAITELWNGTAWTEVNDLNTSRRQGGGGFGIATSGLAFGGETPGAVNVANTESWNGTSWTAENALSTARRATQGAGHGGNDSGLAAGGVGVGSPSQSNATEEWNGAGVDDVRDFDVS